LVGIKGNFMLPSLASAGGTRGLTKALEMEATPWITTNSFVNLTRTSRMKHVEKGRNAPALAPAFNAGVPTSSKEKFVTGHVTNDGKAKQIDWKREARHWKDKYNKQSKERGP
jgi:hypothetical protein